MRGKLPTEIFTPLTVVSLMAEKTSIIYYKSIYDPACGDGNILCYIIELLKNNGISENDIINRIFGADISLDNINKCKTRISKLLPNVDESKINAHIKCKDTLIVPDYFTYDLIFMNPPYERDLHKKFLIFGLSHAKNVLSIQPCQFLYKHNDLRNIDIKCQQLVDKYCASIDIVNPNTLWPLNIFASPVGIFYFIKKKNDGFSPIVVNDLMTKDSYSIYSCNEIIKEHSKLSIFYSKLENFLKNQKSLADYVESTPTKEWVVSFPKVRGHVSRKDNIYCSPDFATIATRGNKPIHKSAAISTRQNFSFDTEAQAKNFLSYIKTDFARTCLYLHKHGVHLDNNEFKGIPYLDFNYIYTDDMLFDMVGCKNPKVIPQYY